MIPHNSPYIPEKAGEYISDVLESRWLSSGRFCRRAERLLCDIVDESARAVMVSNGTSALYLALLAIGVSRGDEVLVPSYSCSAILNAIYMAGALPVPCDIDENTLSISRETAAARVTHASKAVIAVHTYGLLCDVDGLYDLGLPVIEDCSQALGSRFGDGTSVGSRGDISIFSFYASKMVTGGNGGAILSKNVKYMEFVEDYIDFDSPREYKRRFNFQLSDINAALVAAGLESLDELLFFKKRVAAEYMKCVKSGYNIRKGINHYRFLLDFESERGLKDCRDFLESRGIATIIPTERRELLHNYLGLDDREFPICEDICERLLSLPIHTALTDENLEYIKEVLYDYFRSSAGV